MNGEYKIATYNTCAVCLGKRVVFKTITVMRTTSFKYKIQKTQCIKCKGTGKIKETNNNSNNKPNNQ